MGLIAVCGGKAVGRKRFPTPRAGGQSGTPLALVNHKNRPLHIRTDPFMGRSGFGFSEFFVVERRFLGRVMGAGTEEPQTTRTTRKED